ncbi:MAG: trehalose-6-phosphate synthase [Nanoarchaeota archaeon]
MPAIILASNRSPLDFRLEAEDTPSLGGLVQALYGCLQQHDLWVAVSQGDNDPNLVDQDGIIPFQAEHAGTPAFRIKKIFLDREAYGSYYDRFSNGFLWPLFHLTKGAYHEMSKPFPRPHFDGNDFFLYSLVNDIFAQAIVSHAEDDSLVWVQDYHFLLLPEKIKERRERLTVGQFLHVPMFHPRIIDRYLRNEEKARQGLEYLIKGMLANDLLGFHIPEYIENFAAAVKQFFPLSSVRDTSHGLEVSYAGRTCYVEPFPIGVDVASVLGNAPPASLKISDQGKELQSLIDEAKRNERLVLLGLERADYTKGLIERLAIIECLLQEGIKLQYIGVATPSRKGVKAYEKLAAAMSRHERRINARWKERLNYLPVKNFQTTLHPPENYAFLRQAGGVMITTIEDGMNLVSYEAILAKAGLEYKQRGFVVIGNCGAEKVAKAYGDQHGLIRVDPFNARDAAHRIIDALTSRYTISDALVEHVKGQDITTWRNTYLERLQEIGKSPAQKGKPFAPAARTDEARTGDN